MIDVDPRAVILVEGLSDRPRVEALAAAAGATSTPSASPSCRSAARRRSAASCDEYGPPGLDLRLAGLCDAAEEREFRRALERAGLGDDAHPRRDGAPGFYVCEADLEDELIRALGADAVEAVVDAQGELGSFRTLQKQPAWRGRPTHEQLRRFMGSGGSRKIRYARLLVEALDPRAVPRPLAGVLAHV